MNTLDVHSPTESFSPSAPLEVSTNAAHSNLESSAVIADSSGTMKMTQHELLPTVEAGKLTPKVNGIVTETSEAHAIISPHSLETAEKLDQLDLSKHGSQVNVHKGLIDTAAPFESVKEFVTKFGGITSWKAHKIQMEERRKFIEQELESAQEEIPKYKKQFEVAKDSKEQVIGNLDNTKRLIEELKLNLERAQLEEQQAKQDAEFAILRVEVIENGIASDEVSAAARAQLEVTQMRHASVLKELEATKDELEKLRAEYELLVAEKDMAAKRAEEVAAASIEVDNTVEELTLELIETRQSLEVAQVAHLEAEEKTIREVVAKEQDSFNWENELEQSEVVLDTLNQQRLSEKDLKLKLDSASALLLNLKAEVATYMEAKLDRRSVDEVILKSPQEVSTEKTDIDLQALVASSRKELENVRVSSEKATEEANCLKMAALSLNSELDTKRTELATVSQRDEIVTIAVASLETDLNRISTELGLVQMKEKEVRENMVDLPKKLQELSREADKEKSLAQLAHEELKKTQKEAEEVRTRANTMSKKLYAVQKEIEAARESERLALDASKALQESALITISGDDDSNTRVTLSMDKYNELSQQSFKAEERARVKVEAAISKIKVAKESELKSLEKLDETYRQIIAKKEELTMAIEKAEVAEGGKLGMEQELTKLKAKHKQEGSNSDTEEQEEVNFMTSLKKKEENDTDTGSSPEVKDGKKKKAKLFPRVIMFFAKKNKQMSK